VEHVQRLNRPFPWRAAALAAAAVALAELSALLALAGIRLFKVHHAAAQTPPAAATGHVSTGHVSTGHIVKALRPRSRASVLVLNGNGVAHAAGEEATQLRTQGYRHAYPTDATNAYARSVVLFRPGWKGEAERLAQDSGIRTVTPLDTRLPGSESGYQLVLVLGAN
jgi:hypothetical protein